MSLFTDRIIRAARLDVNLYEEVSADKEAMGQAVGVVILSSLAAGINGFSRGGIDRLLLETTAALIGWYVWVYIAYFIGTKILPEDQTKANHGGLLRTAGFASAPGLIRVLGLIPGLRWVIDLFASIWMLVTMVIAVRKSLDYKSTFRAFGVCVMGWILQTVIFLLFFSVFWGTVGAALD